MEFYKEGDRSRALCPHCKKKVTTTFKVRTSDIFDGSVSYTVPDILVGVCDLCDADVSVPQQSFAAVSEVRKKSDKETLSFRLPRHLLDVLNNSILALGVEASSDLRGQLLRLYMASIFEDKKQIKKLSRNLQSDLLAGSFKRNSRLSMKFSSQLLARFERLSHEAGLQSRTELIDSIIVSIKEELLDNENPERFRQIKTALLATG